ncbi:hypothetical protein OQA88_11551 [Cercophora sp. LCS_1]
MTAAEALTSRVFFVRHDETEWALHGRQTSTANLELTSTGIAQVSRGTATRGRPKLAPDCSIGLNNAKKEPVQETSVTDVSKIAHKKQSDLWGPPAPMVDGRGPLRWWRPTPRLHIDCSKGFDSRLGGPRDSLRDSTTAFGGCQTNSPMLAALKKETAGSSCEYSVREGAASVSEDIKQKYACTETENRALRELFDYFRSQPENYAWEAFKRLRTIKDDHPLQILQGIRDAERPLLTPPISTTGGQEASEIDATALAGSVIRVPATPWTSVAGEGIVSSLISAYFKWDDPFIYSYIDKELFLRDMRCSIPSQAKYCSPLLVNALCALRSFGSEHVKRVKKATGVDLGAKFVAETKRHLDTEVLKASLPTVQGLYTLFVHSCGEGTNRAGNMYRFSACEMLHRMRPKRMYAELDPSLPRESEYRRALQRTVWGLFVFESLLSNTYQTPSILPCPTVPRPQSGEANDPLLPNIDINGHPFGLLSPEPPLVPGVFEVLCVASVLQYEIMSYNSRVPARDRGSAGDMNARRNLFSKLAVMEDSLCGRMRYRSNPTPQTLYLKYLLLPNHDGHSTNNCRTFINVLASNILRPLPPSTPLPYVPHPSGYATAKYLLLQLCAVDVQIIESYACKWGLTEYSPMFFTGIWNVTTTLIPMLDSATPLSSPSNTSSPLDLTSPVTPSPVIRQHAAEARINEGYQANEDIRMAEDLFTRACALVSVLERDFPVVWFVMQGILALARATGRIIPPGARQFFGRGQMRELEDVPVSFKLPVQEDVSGSLLSEEEGEDESGGVGGDLAGLLRRWGGLSVG